MPSSGRGFNQVGLEGSQLFKEALRLAPSEVEGLAQGILPVHGLRSANLAARRRYRDAVDALRAAFFWRTSTRRRPASGTAVPVPRTISRAETLCP